MNFHFLNEPSDKFKKLLKKQIRDFLNSKDGEELYNKKLLEEIKNFKCNPKRKK